MPSYRVTSVVGLLRPGVRPETVLPAAVAAGAELTTVESSDISVVAGQARVTVRFTADDNLVAARVADHVCATAGALAELGAVALTRRYGNRWYPV